MKLNRFVMAVMLIAALGLSACNALKQDADSNSDAGAASDASGISNQGTRGASGPLGPVLTASSPDQALFKLGQFLFYDNLLGGNKDIACATCHFPTLATGDGRSLSVGVRATGLGPDRHLTPGAALIARNATDIFTRGRPEWTSMFWDSRVSGTPATGFNTPAKALLPAGLDSVLAAQAMFPVTRRDEMRGNAGDLDVNGELNELGMIPNGQFLAIWDGLMKRILAIPAYVALFRAAYPDKDVSELRFLHAANALGAYQTGAFNTSGSPWERFQAGDGNALTAEQKAGADLFFGRAKCASCHSGTLLSDQKHHNTGVPHIGNAVDKGRFVETGNAADLYAFRTPSLHNVAVTGPWQHAGAFTTLEQTVRHYINPEQSLRGFDPSPLAEPERFLVRNSEADFAQILSTLSPRVAAGVALNDQEVAQLVAFLHSLTSPLTDPAVLRKTIPQRVPSGLPVIGAEQRRHK